MEGVPGRSDGRDSNDSDEEIPRRKRKATFNNEDSNTSNDESEGRGRVDAMRSRPEVKVNDMLEVLKRPAPKPKWFITPEIIKRPIGAPNKMLAPKKFQDRAYGSLHSVQRLELMYKLEKHSGPVNAIQFNESGDLLASVSDDRSICLWNWASGKLKCQIPTLHISNVFHTIFLPLQGHLNIMTCGRDGKVTHLEVDTTGSLRSSRLVSRHKKVCHRLSKIAGSPYCFVSCGGDAIVRTYDIREKKPVSSLRVKQKDKKVGLYCVDCHPTISNEYVVAGNDEYLRVYDHRNHRKAIWKRCPDKKNSRSYKQISGAVYNYNGTEIIASHRQSIFLWDRTNIESKEYVHKYSGHINYDTAKSVNFFGPKSEYIMSGSDCGNIYFWDKETEAIVQWMAGDNNGVVNSLESHPSFPILATSGIDEDVKIWVPSSESAPTFRGLKSTLLSNAGALRDINLSHGETLMFWPINVRLDETHSSDNSPEVEDNLRVSCSPS